MPIKIRPAIFILENQDGIPKILTMKYNYGGEEVYNLPGGNLELGEYLNEALAREMIEELGIKVSVGELILVGEVHHSFAEQTKDRDVPLAKADSTSLCASQVELKIPKSEDLYEL